MAEEKETSGKANYATHDDLGRVESQVELLQQNIAKQFEQVSSASTALQSSLTQEIRNLGSQFQSWRESDRADTERKFETTGRRIEGVREEVDTKTRSNPQTWLMGIGLLVAIIVPSGSLISAQFNHQNTIRELANKHSAALSAIRDSHEKERFQLIGKVIEDSAERLDEKIVSNSERIAQLETYNREMNKLQGQYEEKFKTQEANLHSAMINRKDMDAKQTQGLENLRLMYESMDRRITDRFEKVDDEIEHRFSNGINQVIEDKIDLKVSPLVERQISMEREVFSTQPNERDMDRK